MKTIARRINGGSVGGRLSLVTLVLAGLVFGSFTWALSAASSRLLQQREIEHIAIQTRSLVDMIDMFDRNLKAEAGRFAKVLLTGFDGKFTVDNDAMVDVAGKQTPTLRHGNAIVNLNFSIPDGFTERTAVTATVFVKTGDDLVRISTSVKKENGERAIGTLLDRGHPAYALLMSGASYSGMATLFGKQYMTKYDPIKDDQGKVIGALYVGLDIMDNIAALKEKIRALKIGETGYFFALDAGPGKDYGRLAVAPEREGDNLLALTDPQGRAFIKEMLDAKQGTIRYPWQDKSQAVPAEKVVAFAYAPSLKWLIAGGAYTNEITAEVRSLRNRYAFIALLAVLAIAALLYLIIKRTIGAPLAQATAAAQRLAAGDLSVALETRRQDEIGLLMQAIDGAGKGLRRVVAEVRAGTDQITVASREIATGNADLSARTESQASNLEQTTSSMEELTATVRQNAGSAAQANQLADAASKQALAGGAAVAQVIETMNAISQSSGKIGDIIGVIDGIAFQTNILALNAAVEAARAGEQGRGFAVVAAEVRMLAQRSAAAAREIKELIENSVAQVGAGSRLVDNAGATIQEVVDSVGRVAGIMSEMSSASTEQSSGIEEIGRAIAQMDQITQQNAALVEQAAAAAESLREQAHSLSQAVGVFKLH
jgi:methyl-accepting chemotaxis protein-2 (aspartate sensor receptor)